MLPDFKKMAEVQKTKEQQLEQKINELLAVVKKAVNDTNVELLARTGDRVIIAQSPVIQLRSELYLTKKINSPSKSNTFEFLDVSITDSAKLLATPDKDVAERLFHLNRHYLTYCGGHFFVNAESFKSFLNDVLTNCKKIEKHIINLINN